MHYRQVYIYMIYRYTCIQKKMKLFPARMQGSLWVLNFGYAGGPNTYIQKQPLKLTFLSYTKGRWNSTVTWEAFLTKIINSIRIIFFVSIHFLKDFSWYKIEDDFIIVENMM